MVAFCEPSGKLCAAPPLSGPKRIVVDEKGLVRRWKMEFMLMPARTVRARVRIRVVSFRLGGWCGCWW